ncbi:hypothetical protein D2V08_03300 [Flagellimonas lutimaris]|uniref:Uncharacterized protein n=1 Tax=Flagellimonas lutimaris TaxID=475082 RepID=A0A3A1NDP2_9FLAO|nr:hypothetical protein [Allomuricauda lutimaris]RIV35985.1 hypothetical protein D2V08_03300 [Allomuricauda lutimaris]
MNPKRMVCIAVSMCLFPSCQFNGSIEKDLLTGIVSKGRGISCEEVYVSNGQLRKQDKDFTYGEVLNLNFAGVEGLERSEGRMYPGMELLIVDGNRDTVLYHPDLYDDRVDGFSQSTTTLQARIVLADPIQSDIEYRGTARIWDKKGDGSFEVALPIKVGRDGHIRTQVSELTFGEIYLFSRTSRTVLINGQVPSQEDFYFIIEGLEGFVDENNSSRVQLNLVAKDAEDNILASSSQMLTIAADELHEQLAPFFNLPASGFENPVRCEMVLLDLKGGGKLKTEAYVEVIK